MLIAMETIEPMPGTELSRDDQVRPEHDDNKYNHVDKLNTESLCNDTNRTAPGRLQIQEDDDELPLPGHHVDPDPDLPGPDLPGPSTES